MTNVTRSIDVLLLESHPYVGNQAAQALEAAGHRVHRCYSYGQSRDCKALADGGGGCPIDDGIDVAVLIRRPLEPMPTHLEDGVRCARRAHLPIVEQGPEHPDPWERWIDIRVAPDSDELALVASAAARWVDGPAHAAIIRTLTPLLEASRIDPAAVECRIEHSGTARDVHVTLPTAADARLRSAIGVRVLDALRATATRTLGNVDVYVHPGPEAPDG